MAIFGQDLLLVPAGEAAGGATLVRYHSVSPSSFVATQALLNPDDEPRRLNVTVRDDIPAQDVVLTELLSQRGPVGWVSATGSGDSGAALQRLAQRCIERGSVLVCSSTRLFDLVLVPRQAAAHDGVAFAAFATRLEGVLFISRTIAAKQVAVVLDLDSTLLESEHLPVQPRDWSELPWRTLGLRQEPSGAAVAGRVCRLPDEPHHAEAVHAATWTWKGAVHSYRIRQRLGWSRLRDLLIQENRPGGKLSTYVLSLGRPLYVQTCWNILDPRGLIISQHQYKQRVNSARPEGVYNCPGKTPCLAFGLRSVFDEVDFNCRWGPVWVADDLPEVFMDKYRDSVFPVPPYRPVASLPNDYDADGGVLTGMADNIMQFWRHCYGADGSGGAVAAASAAAAHALHQLSTVPLPAGAVESWAVGLFVGHEALGSAMSVRAFLESQQVSAAMPDAIPSAPFVPENDENAPVVKAVPSGASFGAAPAGRPLRPSSRQDHVLPAGQPLPGKAAQQQHGAPCCPGTSSAAGEEAEAEDAHATVSILPAGEGEEEGQAEAEARLVLLLASTWQAAASSLCAESSSPGDVEVEEAVTLDEEAVAAAQEGGAWGGCGPGACLPVEVAAAGAVAGSATEEAELPAAADVATSVTGSPGRKRTFDDAVGGQDSLMGPVAPPAVEAAVV